jgi:hypothetical protein
MKNEYNSFLFSVEEQVATIALNRPESVVEICLNLGLTTG